MSRPAKILIVCDQEDAIRIEKHIQREASLDGSHLFEIYEIETPMRKDREAWSKIAQTNGQELEDLLFSGEIDLVIANSGYAVNWSELNDFAEIKLLPSLKVLLKKIKELLEERQLDWLSAARKELEKSELGNCSPEAWLEQFVRLNCKELGRNLLKLLRVITNHELRDAFSLNASERDGLVMRHAFVKDADPGSSSQTIKPLLAKMHGDGILELDLEDPGQWSDLDADVICVYEDGLWSGVELVKRIEAIGKAQEASPTDIAFYFRFAATSDIGLIAARAASRTLRLPRLNFHGMAEENHFRFLERGFKLESIKGLNNDAVRPLLDGAVTPYAFSFDELWGADKQAHIDACRRIGAQLAKPFLERRKRAKNGPEAAPVVISDEKAMEWSLGALGFGSTIVFASSIPKPVVPVMWLHGPVELNGKSTQWRPLFLDARRTGVGVDVI